MINSSECKKHPPILIKLDLPIFLHLDGLATRKDLANLSEKRVTAKVRENLRRIINRKQLRIACKAKWIRKRWIGEGSYNRKKFNWIVIDGFYQISSFYYSLF